MRRWDAATRLLERDEREAVQGDLAEAGENGWRGLIDVLGLVLRRHANHWRNWRPWLSAFGLALPGSLLLMGFSLSVSRAYQQCVDSTVVKTMGLAAGLGSLCFCARSLC